MMNSEFPVLLLTLVSLCNTAEAKTGESMEIKLYNRDFQASASEMQEMLKNADLESHGYSKEVTTKLVKGPWNNKPNYKKSYFYFKVVNCSKIQEIEQELDALMPGVLGDEMAPRLRKEMKIRQLSNMGQCRAGLEVVLQEAESGYDKNKVSRRRKKRHESKKEYNLLKIECNNCRISDNNGINNGNNNGNNNDNNNSNNNGNNDNDNDNDNDNSDNDNDNSDNDNDNSDNDNDNSDNDNDNDNSDNDGDSWLGR